MADYFKEFRTKIILHIFLEIVDCSLSINKVVLENLDVITKKDNC